MRLIFNLVSCFAAISFLTSACASPATEDNYKTENIVIVLIDGLRWEEVFRGADPRFFGQDGNGLFRQANQIPMLKLKFVTGDQERDRNALMPFLWGTIAQRGQIYGNQDIGNRVAVGNDYQFSYPSHSEILTGIVEPKITGNIALPNPNQTVLEALQNLDDFENKTAAFSSWHHYPFIVNSPRSKVFVHSPSSNKSIGDEYEVFETLRDFVSLQPRGLHSDILTFHLWREYMEARQPRVTHVVYSVTDRAAHAGHYDDYLVAAQQADVLLSRMWEWIESQANYSGKTTLIVVTDHGRGAATPKDWKYHGTPGYYGFNVGDPTVGDEWAWLAILGPDTPALGEIRDKLDVTIGQVAPTAAFLLGYDLGEVVQDERVADPIYAACDDCKHQ